MNPARNEHPDALPVGIRAGSDYLPALESLRGVAILLVFVFHADGVIYHGTVTGTWVSPLAAFVHAGHTGVTLFFVLSAFLLSRPYWQEAAGGPRVSALHFFRRRALRILPLYWSVVIVSSLLYAFQGNGDLLAGLPYLFFFNSVDGVGEHMFPYSDVWWSLATEAQFYLALPIVGALGRFRTGHFLLVALGLAYGAWYAHVVQTGPGIQLAINLAGRLPAFAIGGAAAWLHLRHGDALKERFHQISWLRMGGADLLLFGVIIGLGFLLREVVFRGFFDAEWSWHAWHVAEALLWASVILLILLTPVRTAWLLERIRLGVVGRLSYSLYLIHFPIVLFTLISLRSKAPATYEGWSATAIAYTAGSLALALAASAITYAVIERPFLRSKARVPA